MGYTLCIDGGGSKTLLQILDNNSLVTFQHNGIEVTEAYGTCSNINTVGETELRKTLHTLFTSILVKGITLLEILPTCRIVAGMAGVGNAENKEKVVNIFREFANDAKNIHVMTDVEINVKLLTKDGIALISGTGSIAMGKCGEKTYREGGLGPDLGDEGSGHIIGKNLLKAIIAEENRQIHDSQRNENPGITDLKKTLQVSDVPDIFHVGQLRTLIPKAKQITPSDYAKLSPIVFQEALKQNLQAIKIVDEAAKDLHTLIVNLEDQAKLENYELHLHGGVFKGEHAELLINKMKELLPAIKADKILNRADENTVMAFARIFFQSR